MKFKEILALPNGTLIRLPCGREELIVEKDGSLVRFYFLAPGSIERNTQSEIDLQHPLQLSRPYTQALMLGLIWQSHPRKVYSVGLGGGRVPLVLHHYLPETDITVAETSSEVFQVAHDYFGVTPDAHLHIVIRDGWEYLKNRSQEEKYDLIFVDAYHAAEDTPSQFTTVEFHNESSRRLAPQGVMLMNMFRQASRLVKTLQALQETYQYVARVIVGENSILIGLNDGETNKERLIQRAVDLEQKLKLTFPLKTHAQNIEFTAS